MTKTTASATRGSRTAATPYSPTNSVTTSARRCVTPSIVLTSAGARSTTCWQTVELTDSARQLYYTELGQIDAYEEHLKAQLQDITRATSGGGEAVGRDQAHDIEQLIDDARIDLREDVASLFRAYDRFVKGRSYLEDLKANLAARKEWLEKNAPSGTPDQ